MIPELVRSKIVAIMDQICAGIFFLVSFNIHYSINSVFEFEKGAGTSPTRKFYDKIKQSKMSINNQTFGFVKPITYNYTNT